MAKITHVALELLKLCKEKNYNIDYFKLQKLAYICQCVHYARFQVPLSPEKIWKWSYGGGFKELYSFSKKNNIFSCDNISEENIRSLRDTMDDLLLFESSTINFVINNFAQKDVNELVNIVLEDPLYSKLKIGDRIRLEELSYFFISEKQKQELNI